MSKKRDSLQILKVVCLLQTFFMMWIVFNYSPLLRNYIWHNWVNIDNPSLYIILTTCLAATMFVGQDLIHKEGIQKGILIGQNQQLQKDNKIITDEKHGLLNTIQVAILQLQMKKPFEALATLKWLGRQSRMKLSILELKDIPELGNMILEITQKAYLDNSTTINSEIETTKLEGLKYIASEHLLNMVKYLIYQSVDAQSAIKDAEKRIIDFYIKEDDSGITFECKHNAPMMARLQRVDDKYRHRMNVNKMIEKYGGNMEWITPEQDISIVKLYLPFGELKEEAM